jgi:hypothetical protein
MPCLTLSKLHRCLSHPKRSKRSNHKMSTLYNILKKIEIANLKEIVKNILGGGEHFLLFRCGEQECELIIRTRETGLSNILPTIRTGFSKLWLKSVLWIRIRIHMLDPHPHRIKIRIRIKIYRIRANFSTFSRIWSFIWRLGSGSASGSTSG